MLIVATTLNVAVKWATLVFNIPSDPLLYNWPKNCHPDRSF